MESIVSLMTITAIYATIFLLLFVVAAIVFMGKIEKAIGKITKAIETITICSTLSDKPMKPKIEEEILKKDSVKRTTVCPNCGKKIWSCEKCCSNCGQRIDWGDEK